MMDQRKKIYDFYISCVKDDDSIHEVTILEYFHETNEYKKYKELYNKTIGRKYKLNKIFKK